MSIAEVLFHKHYSLLPKINLMLHFCCADLTVTLFFELAELNEMRFQSAQEKKGSVFDSGYFMRDCNFLIVS